MKLTQVCSENKMLSKSIYNFLENVPTANEESITDYLIWQMRENITLKSYFVKTETFTRHEENTTYGADLMLWIKKGNKYLPLLIQSKKFIKHDYNSYKMKLNYKSNKSSKTQIDTLLNYAVSKSIFPYYLFYTIPNKDTSLLYCCNSSIKSSLVLVDAKRIKWFANQKTSKLRLNDILNSGYSFCRIFCCDYFFEEKKDYVVDKLPEFMNIAQKIDTKIQKKRKRKEDDLIYDDNSDKTFFYDNRNLNGKDDERNTDFINYEWENDKKIISEIEEYELNTIKTVGLIDITNLD